MQKDKSNNLVGLGFGASGSFPKKHLQRFNVLNGIVSYRALAFAQKQFILHEKSLVPWRISIHLRAKIHLLRHGTAQLLV